MNRSAKKLLTLILVLALIAIPFPRAAHADLPVVDFVNSALNQFRNALMQDQFTQEIIVFFDQLTELENTYQEIIRFNSGIEEFIRSFIDDAASAFGVSQGSFRETFLTGFEPSPEQDAIRNLGDILEGNGDPTGIKSYIETINGEDPQSIDRAYITFDESQVGEAYLLAHEIRKRSEATKAVGEGIQDQAQTASPKGAAKLTADGVGKMIVLTQENQDVSVKSIELQAALLEQFTRDEKRFERARIDFTDEMNLGVETLGRPG